MQFHRLNRLLSIVAPWALALGVAGSAVCSAQTSGVVISHKVISGGDLRFRNEYFDNALTLDDDAALHAQDYFRLRTRLWMAHRPAETIDFYARFASEVRYWMKDSYAKQHSGTGVEWRYGLVDSLYLKTRPTTANNPVTLTVGRQELQLGDPSTAWLVVDGTPGDGSWTLYFDAVRLTYQARQYKTQIDVIALAQRAHPDSALPILGSENTYGLTEQNERGVIVYASNKSLRNIQLDGYYIYKQDRKAFSAGDDADLSTYGAKIIGTPSPSWRYHVEGAWQTGRKQDASVNRLSSAIISPKEMRDVEAYGWNSKLTYSFKDRRDNQLSLVAEYLSGDDASTPGKDEMFDVLWGRYPRFSEAYIFTTVNETGGKISQINNLFRYGANWTIAPFKGTTFSVTYNLFKAPEASPTRATKTALFTQVGDKRGDFYQCVVKHQFSKTLSGHLWGECIRQGDFYANRGTILFFRGELMYSF